MAPIESGSTVDQRVRTGIFLLMCLGMGGWFAYDGFYGYAAKNLDWASQKLPQRPENLKTNPRATKDNLLQVAVGDSPDRIRGLLGEPTLDLPRTLVFVGKEITATIRIDDQGQVLSNAISTPDRPAAAGQAASGPSGISDTTNVMVTRARAELVKPGMAESAVRELLREPASARDRAMWYIGPAAYGEFHLAGGKVSARPDVQENEHRSEWDITLQKIIAAAVCLAAVYALLRFWQAMRARIVVDDSGLTYNGRRIPWDSMIQLKTDQYQDKAWVDLEYRDGASERSLRLDALFIQQFKEIMTAICQRKGFTMPRRDRGDGETVEQ